jgi:hypothetical protein
MNFFYFSQLEKYRNLRACRWGGGYTYWPGVTFQLGWWENLFVAMIVHFTHVQKERLPRVDGVAAVEAGVGEALRMATLHVAAHIGTVTRAEPADRAPEPALSALHGAAGTDEHLDLLVHG